MFEDPPPPAAPAPTPPTPFPKIEESGVLMRLHVFAEPAEDVSGALTVQQAAEASLAGRRRPPPVKGSAPGSLGTGTISDPFAPWLWPFIPHPSAALDQTFYYNWSFL